MVGTVGRTDLLGPAPREDLARDLYRSLRDEILTLPDDLVVYPTHGAGSFCSAPGATERTTTIGRERRTNPFLQAARRGLVRRAAPRRPRHVPDELLAPARGQPVGPASTAQLPPLPRLSVDEARSMLHGDGVLVDVRPIADFAAGHVPGSLSIELRPVFSSWLGWVVEPDRPLIFILGDEQDRDELVRQCLDVGYEMLAGEIDGGIDAWRAAGHARDDHRTGRPERSHGNPRRRPPAERVRDGTRPGASSTSSSEPCRRPRHRRARSR